MQSSFLGYHFLYRLGLSAARAALTARPRIAEADLESDLVPEPIHELELHVAPGLRGRLP